MESLLLHEVEQSPGLSLQTLQGLLVLVSPLGVLSFLDQVMEVLHRSRAEVDGPLRAADLLMEAAGLLTHVEGEGRSPLRVGHDRLVQMGGEERVQAGEPWQEGRHVAVVQGPTQSS